MRHILLSLLLSSSSIVMAMKPDAQDLSEERPLGRAVACVEKSWEGVEDISDDEFPGPYVPFHSRPDASSEPESLEASLKAFESIRHTPHLQEALEMGEKLKKTSFESMTPQQQGKLIRGMVKTYMRDGNVREAEGLIRSFVKRLNSAEQCNREFVLTWLLYADVLYRRSHQDSAITIYQNLAENGEILYSKAKALISLGNARVNDKGNYARAAKLARGMGDRALEAQAFIGLGHARDGNRIEHYGRAAELAQEIGDSDLEAQAFIGLGNTMCAERNNIRGITHFHRAVQADPSQNQQLRSKAMRKKSFIEGELRQLRSSLTPEENQALRTFFPELFREKDRSNSQSIAKRSRIE